MRHVRYRRHDDTTGSEQRGEFAQHRRGVDEMLEHVEAEDDVELQAGEFFGEIELFDIADDEFLAKLPGSLGGGLVDLDTPDPAAAGDQRFGDRVPVSGADV